MMHNNLFHEQLTNVSPELVKETEWSADIVDKIDRILKEKGMTQRELASKIGCNETQIVRWTRGFPNYTLSTLAKLSVALGEDLICIDTLSSIVAGYNNVSESKSKYLSDIENHSCEIHLKTKEKGKKSSRKV